MTTLSEPSPISSSEYLSDLPRLPRDEGGPVFAEPWQAQAFALAVTLSEQGHFTWKEWAAALANELQAAARRGEPDDGSQYYEHWLAALENLITARQLADSTELRTRKDAWTEAYRNTPHGRPVEVPQSLPKADARWILAGLVFLAVVYWIGQRAIVSLRGLSAIPQVGPVASAAFGSLLGLRHALEPDHLAAVSTLMTGERSSAKAAWLGACWGLGHTVTLMAVGASLVLLRADMPPQASDIFELGVVLMLVGFGVRAMYQGTWGRPAGRSHSHAKSSSPTGAPGRRWTIARRPLVVGAVHGLAGSGALIALVVTTLPSTLARLSYLALFGAGTTIGMIVLSGLLGWPLARMGGHGGTARGLSLAVGGVSTALGLLWGYSFISRLF